MVDVLKLVHAFAPAKIPVFFYGETGTGKTLLAEYLHELSGREGGFHVLSVGVMSPQLAEDHLFGHVPGGFTDARGTRAGRVATAGAGTLLLDDVQNLDAASQAKLFELLDRGTYSPVGSDRVIPAACRIVLAMSDHPDVLMKQGRLLPDLRYRFGECAVGVPPLRERREEVLVFAHGFLGECERITGVRGPTRFADLVLEALEAGTYAGNVRQLGGVVVRAYLLAAAAGASEIREGDLPEWLRPLRYRRGDVEGNRAAAERALAEMGGNRKRAAQLLGTSRNTLKKVLSSGGR